MLHCGGSAHHSSRFHPSYLSFVHFLLFSPITQRTLFLYLTPNRLFTCGFYPYLGSSTYPMKKLLLSLIVISCFVYGRAQWVEIPDPAFLTALQNTGAGNCINATFLDTTCTEVQTLTEFNCSNCGISDLEGLQYFHNLDSINVEFNNITYVPQLPSGLKKLQLNDCYYLTDLPPLPAGLQQLYLGNTGLTSYPALPSGIKALSIGMAPGNFLDTLPPAFPPALESLTMWRINDVALPSLPSTLTFLDIENSLINTTPALPPNLVYLYINSSNIYNVTTLPASLRYLQMDWMPVLTAYPAFPTGLQQISLQNIPLSTLPVLPDSLNSFTATNCGINAIASFPAKLSALTLISDTSLTALPLLPPQLSILQVFASRVQSFPNFPSTLTFINVSYNSSLTALPPIPSGVYYFSASYTNITGLSPLPAAIRNFQMQKTQFTGQLTIPLSVDSMLGLNIDSNPNLLCISHLPNRIVNFSFKNTGLTCFPNYANITSSIPAQNSLPVCGIFNANGCSVPWNISGQTYFGNSCTYNSAFSPAPNVKVQLFENGILQQQVFSVLGGNYYFDVDHYGTYTVRVDTANMPFNVVCPAGNTYSSVIQLVDSMDYNLNFALQCKPGFDAAVTAITVPGVFRPAQSTSVHITAGDFSAMGFSADCAAGVGGQVKLVLNGPISYAGIAAGALTPSAVINDTVLWNVADLSALTTDAFHIIIATDTNAAIGASACFSVSILPAAPGDNNPGNNTLQYCQPVVNSYDPNDKSVYPVAVLDTLGYMTYTVRFQNTGNALALHVQVIDTLDSNLDPATFEVLGYSHPVFTQLTGSIVKFNFANINLPDSNSNEPGSHGYVQYKVKTRPHLSAAATVQNTAYIYFDFNTPVVTNTVENAFGVCVTTYGSLQHSICAGSSFAFNAQNLTAAGTYYDTLQNQQGCDSIITLTLSVINPSLTNVAQSICSGDTFDFNGEPISAEGTYADTLQNQFGCDSIVTLNLQFYPAIPPTVWNASMCQGDTFHLGSAIYTASGNYSYAFQSMYGCDSVVNLNLTVDSLPIAGFVRDCFDGIPAVWDCGWAARIVGNFQNSDSLEWHIRDITSGSVDTTVYGMDTILLRSELYINWYPGYFITVPPWHDIEICLTAYNNCGSASFCDTTHLWEEGISETPLNNFKLYPNPAKDYVTISAEQNAVGGLLQLRDITGRVISTQVLNSKQFILNTSTLAAGVYVVTLQQKDGAIGLKRLVIK